MLRSPEARGVASDGGLRKSRPFTIRNQRPTAQLIDYIESVIEMHAFLVTLVRQFDFSLPNNGQEIKRSRTVGIVPVVIGEEHRGPQMPLRVSALENE